MATLPPTLPQTFRQLLRLTAVCFLFVALPAIALANNSEANKNIRLQDIPLQDFSSITGDFTQIKNSTTLNIEFESSGRFFYSRNVGFLWLNQQPFAHASFYSTTNSWDYELDENGRLVTNKNKQKTTKHINKIIQAMIHHDWKTVDKLFHQSTRQQNGTFYSTLTPKSKQAKKFISSMELNFSNHLDSYKIQLKNGEEIKVVFNNMQIDPLPFNNCEQPNSFFALVCTHINSSLQ